MNNVREVDPTADPTAESDISQPDFDAADGTHPGLGAISEAGSNRCIFGHYKSPSDLREIYIGMRISTHTFQSRHRVRTLPTGSPSVNRNGEHSPPKELSAKQTKIRQMLITCLYCLLVLEVEREESSRARQESEHLRKQLAGRYHKEKQWLADAASDMTVTQNVLRLLNSPVLRTLMINHLS